MTTGELRQDAARREALAKDATPGYWRRLDANPCKVVRVPRCMPIGKFEWEGNAKLVCAHDPPAALAQVERDRLLADCIEALIELRGLVEFDDGVLLARFAALEVPK